MSTQPIVVDPTQLAPPGAAPKVPTPQAAGSGVIVVDPAALATTQAPPQKTPQQAPVQKPQAPTLSERVGNAIPDWLTPALAAGEKYLVDPFEKMSAAGAKAGSEAATDVTSAMATHPLEALTGAARQAMGLPPTDQESADLAEAPTRFAKEHPVTTGIAQGVGETAGSIAADPRMWALGLGEAGSAAMKRLISAGFSAQMLYGAAKSVPGVQDALKKGDHREAARLITDAGINAAFGALSGAHAIAGEKAPVATEAPAEETAVAAQPRTAAGALPQGKEPLALPPKPGLAPEEIRTNLGPRRKGPIALPAQTPTRIPSGLKPIALGESAVVDPREVSKANGKPSTAAIARPQTAQDLRVRIAQLDKRDRELTDAMGRARAGSEANSARIKELRKISAERSDVRTQLETIAPRPTAKPLNADFYSEKFGPRVGGEGKTNVAEAAPKAVEKVSKSPTYEKLPPELREVVDRVAQQHNHLPQSLREADEAEHRKLAAPGTPLKEQVARRIARDEGLAYTGRNGETVEPKPLAKPLSERRTPIGERRLEDEGPPEGTAERRINERRAAVQQGGREVMRSAIAQNARDILRDPEATEHDKAVAQGQLDDMQAHRGEASELTDIGEARKAANRPEPPKSGAKVGDMVRFRDRNGNELEGTISDHSPQTQNWRVETKGGSVAVPDDKIVSRSAKGTLPGMERAVEEQKRGAEKVKGEQLSKEMARPLSNIDERAGAMERESPLFRDTEASGQKGFFTPKAEKKITLGEGKEGTRPEERATGTMRHDILVGGKRVGEVHVSPKDETLRVTWMGEPLTREGGKPEELDALSNKLGQNGVRQVIRELHRLYPEAEELSYTREGGAAGRSAREHGEVAARTMLLGKGSRLHAGVEPAMVRDLFDKLGRLYEEHVAGPAIEKMGLGRAHGDVEAVDPKLASRIRRYEAAPLYFATKAADLVKHIVGDLTPSRERLFTLMADADSRENLKENHSREYAEAQRDPKIQAALDRYRPWEAQLTKARQILGGSTLDRDYLRRVYSEHVAGIGKGEKGKQTPRANFDRVITPQTAGGPGRKATAEYHYSHGLHEFGPAFGTKFVATMTKIAEHATAADFLGKATKLEPGDALPPSIEYNGRRFYRSDIVRAIREARPGKESRRIAEDLGIRELPKPKEARTYEVYDPAVGRGGTEAPKYLGPSAVVDALHGLDKSQPKGGGPVTRFLREQIIGLGFGVPHVMNIMRRISQGFPAGSGSPANWVRAARVLTDHELWTRALARTNDPTYDALLRWGGMSPHEVESFKAYTGGNFNPANWLRVFAKVGHDYLFGPAGLDRRARLYVADLVKSQRPDLSAEKVSQLVNDQLGRYNRATWTEMQNRVGRYMLFPGWDFSSMNWVMRHPIRTTVPPAILIMLANQVIHRYGGNRDEERFDPFAVHVGHHAYGLGLVNEPFARRVAAPAMRATEEALQGGTRRQVAAAAGREIPYAVGAPFGMTLPQVRLPAEMALGKDEFGRDIVGKGDWTRPGRVLPSKGLEDEAEHALISFFPQGQRVEEGKQNAAEMALSNLGVQRKADQPRLPQMSERESEYLNVQDDVRALEHQAEAIAEDHTLTPEEKQRRLLPLRLKYQNLIKRDRPH